MYATHTYMYTRLHMCEYMLVCVCDTGCLSWLVSILYIEIGLSLKQRTASLVSPVD